MTAASEREEFSRRLRQLLKQNGYDAQSAAKAAREFNERYPEAAVSQQAVRKWLGGEAIPAQEKVRALSRWLGCTADYLRFGGAQSQAHELHQPQPAYRIALSDQELVRRYRKLGERQQAAVAEIISALATRSK